jgi:hypothetical protein
VELRHKDGICKKCLNESQRIYRKNSLNKVTKKYEKTKNGFLVRCYRNMMSRILGIQKDKSHLYKGKELLSKEDFYIWAKSSKIFDVLFKNWEDSGYNRKLTPSVDRKDSSIGYVQNNMEWVTHSENSRRGAKSKVNKNKIF